MGQIQDLTIAKVLVNLVWYWQIDQTNPQGALDDIM